MYVIIYVTAPDVACARSIASECISQKLIACANILPHMESIYSWEGKVINDSEVSILLKTTKDKVSEVTSLVKQLHPAKCPCVISLPILDGNPDFLKWISDSVNNSQSI